MSWSSGPGAGSRSAASIRPAPSARAAGSEQAGTEQAGSEQGWTHVGWHRIERGAWNGEAHRLTWTLYDGRRGSAGLAAPGRVPELFRERIAASIAVEEVVAVGQGRSIVVSGRRDLSESNPALEWRRTLSRGLSWNQPGVRELADQVLARLQAEYGR